MTDVLCDNLPAMVHASACAANFRQSVMALQREHLQLPQAECPLVHTVIEGTYLRQVTIPADTIVIGKIHRHETLNILVKGEITVVTEASKKRLAAPCMFMSPPGTKKAAITHSEVIWVNACPTELTDLAAIEQEMVCDEYDDDGFLGHVNETLELEDLCHS